MTFGERLTELRKEKHWSQDALAEMLSISRQSVSKWENNSSVPDLDKLVKLSALFGVTLDELVRGTVAPQTPVKSKLSDLFTKVVSLYQDKAYLLGWLLILGGFLRANTTLNALRNYYAQTNWATTLRFINMAILPSIITFSTMLLTGVLFLFAGRRFSGHCRWYHLGWFLILSAVFGLRFIPSLHTGLLESFLISIWILPQYGNFNIALETLTDLLMNLHLFFLLALGLLLLWRGKYDDAKKSPE